MKNPLFAIAPAIVPNRRENRSVIFWLYGTMKADNNQAVSKVSLGYGSSQIICFIYFLKHKLLKLNSPRACISLVGNFPNN